MISRFSRQRFVAVVISAGAAFAQPPSANVSPGQDICTYGYVMDEACIDLGVLMDNQELKTLEHPEEHSVHCLVDVPICYESPFHILTDPSDYSSGDTTYGPGWSVSDNALLLTNARKLGSVDAGCGTCDATAGGTVHKGLRLQVTGTVVTVDPPVLEATSATYLAEGDAGCVDNNGGGNDSTSGGASSNNNTSYNFTTNTDGDTSPSEATGASSRAARRSACLSGLLLVGCLSSYYYGV